MIKVQVVEAIKCGYHGLILIEDCKTCEVYDGRDGDCVCCLDDET
jgi:hypothetical protein